MKGRDFFLLGLLGLLVALPVALLQTAPGYMDADYYYLGGRQIAQSGQLQEPILWHYLDDPAGLPHPSHGYWMPLASLVAAIGIRLAGTDAFFWGRLPFLVVVALIPALTARLSYSLTRSRNSGLVAGVLAALPGFYLPFLTTSDTFGIYMVLGAIFFLILEAGSQRPTRSWQPLALGLTAGCMHLARADGIIWLLIGLLGVVGMSGSRYIEDPEARPTAATRHRARLSVLFLAGYLLVMGPWFARNQISFGAPLAPGGSRALWLTHYDELFAFPASNLTPQRWASAGLAQLVSHRFWALRLNLGNMLAVQGLIILAPLIILGFWQSRRRLSPRLGTLAWGLTFLVMTAIFPFPGARGGFFHSGAALQPLFWAAVPAGLNAFIEWGVGKRGWIARQAGVAFGAGLVLLALALTVVAVQQRLVGDRPGEVQWGRSALHYKALEAALNSVGAGEGELVLVNNPPGFHLATGRPAIVIPNEEPAVLEAVAHRYDARYVLLEVNHPRPLDVLYEDPENSTGFRLLAEVGETLILRVEPSQ